MKINITRETNFVDLVIQSEKLDSKISPDLKSQFIMLADEPGGGALLIDLGFIKFVDSSGLSALLLANRLYRDANRKLVLYNVSEWVQKLIAISQLTSVFTTASDRESAENQV